MSTTNSSNDDHRPAHDRALDEDERESGRTGEGEDRPRRSDTRESVPAESRSRGTPFTQQLGRIFVAIIAVLFGIFAVANAQFVDFNWIFGETQVVEEGGERIGGGVPLIILLVVSFVLGALAGWFATWRRKRHHRDAP